jgi:hypothetical protein
MSTYRVDWIPYARALLASAWLGASNRNAVTRAQNAIDKALAVDPKGQGRELSEGLWKIERLPLAAYYEIDESSGTVTVTDLAFIP